MPDEHKTASPPDAWDLLTPDEQREYTAAGFTRASYNALDRSLGEETRRRPARGCPRPGRYGEE
jgi:hypothetical protein